MNHQVVILAGGLATRLGELVSEIPKSLININGVPFIIHQLNYLKSQGLQNVHFCLGHKGDLIINMLNKNTELEMNITYSFDGSKQLGTGGAVINALPYLEEEFFLQYGDVYLPVEYKKIYNFYKANKNMNIMAVYKNEKMYDNSNIILDKSKIILYDKKLDDPKMNYIDYGLSFLKKDSFYNHHINNFLDLSDIYKLLIKKDKMLGFEVFKRFYEIGKPQGIKDTEKYLKSNIL